jgi:methyltransferase (TIGR00027 family)
VARADNDSWDLATSVGATATMVAAYRAAATKRDQPLIHDPFAEPLVRAVGMDFFTRLAGGELDAVADDAVLHLMTDVFALRTRFFDDFFADAGRAGIRQAVIVASGLDARPYRPSWPAGTTAYEIDQPEVIEFKTNTLAKLGAAPRADRRTVGIDLRQERPITLRQAGFDPTQPTAWLEGLLIGFCRPTPRTGYWMTSACSALPTAVSLAITYRTPAKPRPGSSGWGLIIDRWCQHGLDLDVTQLMYPGERNDVATYLQAHGWDTVRGGIEELFVAHGLPRVAVEMVSWIVYVTATRK